MKKNDVEGKLLTIGFSAQQSGFKYILDAIMILDVPENKDIPVMKLYREIAKEYDVANSEVSRAIKYTFESIRCVGEKEKVENYIGYDYYDNASSIKMLYMRIKSELSEEGEKYTDNDTLIQIIRREIENVLIEKGLK